MATIAFQELPAHARIWAFTTGREMTESEQQNVQTGVTAFLDQWAAHGAALTAGSTILHDRFLLVGVDQDRTAPSGCSIDAMTHFLRDLGSRLGLDVLDSPNCCFRTDEGIRCVDRNEFRQLVADQKVDASTNVFDLTIPDVEAYRSGSFEQNAGSTWYARAFRMGEPV